MADTLYDAYGQEIELTGEQSACLKYSGSRTLMVKGYAGAGKSIVLMAIAQKYKQAYGNAGGNKVAIFTYQNTLVSTTKESLIENESGDGTIYVGTVNGYFQELYKQMALMGIAPKRKFPFGKAQVVQEQRLKNVDAALREHKSKYGKHRFHDLDLQFWLDEFDWMKDMNVWTDDLDYYLSIPRTGRGGKVRMRASERVTAYQIFLGYCNYLERTGRADWADQTLFVVRHRDMIPEKMKYEHVLIDEAQDLSLAQMTAILGLYTKDMTVAMDMNQRIHGKYWTPKLLGIETTTKKLTKSMRTTKQIDNLAESIRRNNDEQLEDDDKSLRAIPEREGPLPKLVHLRDAAAEKKYVIQLVQRLLEKSSEITIGIIGSKNAQLSVFSSWLTDANIQHERVTKDTTFSMKKPGVKVVTAFGAKGLEFNVVIIPMFAQGYYPYNHKTDDQEALNSFMVQMRNLVYVSMTRAKAQLWITYWGKNGSQFIGEMGKDLYILEGEPIEGTYAKPIKVIASSPAGETFSNSDGTTKADGTRPAATTGTPHRVTDQELKDAIDKLTTKIATARSNPASAAAQPSKPSAVQHEAQTDKAAKSLYVYLKNTAGISVNDKREKGGALWISGSKELLDTVMRDTKKRFGAMWIYSEKRGGYFTKCSK